MRLLHTLSYAEFLALKRDKNKRKRFAGSFIVNWACRRVQVFSFSPKCNSCPRYIQEVRLYRTVRNKATFKFYSADGTKFTIDHIVPRSKNGSNGTSNLQTMCYDCNQKKGAKNDPYLRELELKLVQALGSGKVIRNKRWFPSIYMVKSQNKFYLVDRGRIQKTYNKFKLIWGYPEWEII